MRGLNDNPNYTKIMYGINAIHVPCWMVAQVTDGVVGFAGASVQMDLMYNSPFQQVLIVGEMIVRPHAVVTGDKNYGTGLGNFLLDPWANGWPDTILGDPDFLKQIRLRE